MIRGLVPKERLLEWSVEDGWEPLCSFLGKPVPKEPFPNVNSAAKWAGNEMSVIGKRYIFGAVRNVLVFSAVVGGAWGLYKHFGLEANFLGLKLVQCWRKTAQSVGKCLSK